MNVEILKEVIKDKVVLFNHPSLYKHTKYIWGVDITDELATVTIIPDGTKAYIVREMDNSIADILYSVRESKIIANFAKYINRYIEKESIIPDDDVLAIVIFNINEKNRIEYLIDNSDIFIAVIEKIKNKINDDFANALNYHNFSIAPRAAAIKYKTMEYMQSKYVNDREIKEWVGSATIICNGIHSPKKKVKAGHIIDKHGVTHELYYNDYILKATEDELTFVIISEDVFKTLFFDMSDGAITKYGIENGCEI